MVDVIKVKQKKKAVNVEEYLGYLEKNLTCMREEPEQGMWSTEINFKILKIRQKSLNIVCSV